MAKLNFTFIFLLTIDLLYSIEVLGVECFYSDKNLMLSKHN